MPFVYYELVVMPRSVTPRDLSPFHFGETQMMYHPNEEFRVMKRLIAVTSRRSVRTLITRHGGGISVSIEAGFQRQS